MLQPLLQNATTLITKCASYYKIPQTLLQNVQVITKSVVITKCAAEQGIHEQIRLTEFGKMLEFIEIWMKLEEIWKFQYHEFYEEIYGRWAPYISL